MTRQDISNRPGAIRDTLYALVRRARNGLSTTEVKTGKLWTDGAEIYRKVVDTGALTNGSSTTVAHGITGLDTVISMYGMAQNSGTGDQTSLCRADVNLHANATNIVINAVTTDLSGYTTSFVVIEYTKA